jgi:hypothetical protein
MMAADLEDTRRKVMELLAMRGKRRSLGGRSSPRTCSSSWMLSKSSSKPCAESPKRTERNSTALATKKRRAAARAAVRSRHRILVGQARCGGSDPRDATTGVTNR